MKWIVIFSAVLLCGCGPMWNAHMRPPEDYRDAYFIEGQGAEGQGHVYFVRDYGRYNCMGEVADTAAATIEFPVQCSNALTGTVSLKRISGGRRLEGTMKLSNGESQNISM